MLLGEGSSPGRGFWSSPEPLRRKGDVNLELEDVEDDDEGLFLKIKRGKGAKFRRGRPPSACAGRSSA